MLKAAADTPPVVKAHGRLSPHFVFLKTQIPLMCGRVTFRTLTLMWHHDILTNNTSTAHPHWPRQVYGRLVDLVTRSRVSKLQCQWRPGDSDNLKSLNGTRAVTVAAAGLPVGPACVYCHAYNSGSGDAARTSIRTRQPDAAVAQSGPGSGMIASGGPPAAVHIS